jgi:hypothetical protein
MTTDATGAATTAAPRYSQSVHVLMDEPTRAAVMGLAVLAAADIGPAVRPKEGETLRGLIETQLESIRSDAPTLYSRALRAGRKELAKRAAANATRAK